MDEENKTARPAAEETAEQPPQTQEPTQDATGGAPREDAPLYTKAQVEAMIAERVAREVRKQKSEAERLASMTNEERKAEEDRRLLEEVARLRRENNFFTMGRQASKIFAEHGIEASDALLEMAVCDTAEGTKERVSAMIEAINTVAQQQVKKALAGSPPKKSAGTGKVWTKKEILAVRDTKERQNLIAQHMDLFENEGGK